MALTLRPALPSDLDLLAGMNKRLIKDERSRNPMDLAALRERLTAGLETGEYASDLFLSDARGKGLGTQVLRSLINTRFPRGFSVKLEVLAGNPGAQRFYERIGFAPYATTMVWQPDDLRNSATARLPLHDKPLAPRQIAKRFS